MTIMSVELPPGLEPRLRTLGLLVFSSMWNIVESKDGFKVVLDFTIPQIRPKKKKSKRKQERDKYRMTSFLARKRSKTALNVNARSFTPSSEDYAQCVGLNSLLETSKGGNSSSTTSVRPPTYSSTFEESPDLTNRVTTTPIQSMTADPIVCKDEAVPLVIPTPTLSTDILPPSNSCDLKSAPNVHETKLSSSDLLALFDPYSSSARENKINDDDISRPMTFPSNVSPPKISLSPLRQNYARRSRPWRPSSRRN